MRTFSETETRALRDVQTGIEGVMSAYACKNAAAVREYESRYDADILRSQFAVDADKIIHNTLYNRGSDKTQVFSFYRNDDITRRSSHVQLVSRIARSIGRALRLNLDLIEAIAIGHDVGHTPFGHKGEEFLNEMYHARTGRCFNHNVHSVRVLQKIAGCNLTLQTLDGILCHCGEKAFERYEPSSVSTFAQLNEIIERCYVREDAIRKLRPSTLEGCVVRISDMIAYMGKDRQDAAKAKFSTDFQPNILGRSNPEIITNIVTDIVANSLGQPYLSMSPDVFGAITEMLRENNAQIYQRGEVTQPYYSVIKPMLEMLYERFLSELDGDDFESLIYQHYLNGSIVGNFYRHPTKRYVQKDLHNPNDIVTDFIASMTDDYFVDAFAYLFPRHPLNQEIRYVEYFDQRYTK